MLRPAILLLVLLSFNAWSDQPLTYQDFGQLPDVSDVTLSPGGEKLAATVRTDLEEVKGVSVQVTDLESGEREMVLFTDNSRHFIHWLQWKDDRTLLVGTYYPSERGRWADRYRPRYESRETRLLIIDTETGDVSSPFSRAFLERYDILPSALGNIVDILPDDPEHILMSLPSRGVSARGAIIYRVNINNQRTEVVQRAKRGIYGWRTDRQNRVRTGYTVDDDTVKIGIQDTDGNQWRELFEYEIFSDAEVNILGFGYDPNILYYTAYRNDLKALYKADLRDEELVGELVYADPAFDVSGRLVYNTKSKEVIGTSGSQEGGTVFFDEDFQAVQASIDRAIPNAHNVVYDLTDDLNSFMVYSTGPTESGTFYMGTREPASINAVAYRYNALEPQLLAPVEDYRYETRDGLEIQSWLTKPKDSEGKLPAIMFPHGGPHARDSSDFDEWAQFFASKGYAVLQMNFRGSRGQGHALFKSGLQSWGKEMQDDIQDGALALIEDGIVDPERICIVGASYGGYAALMGAVKTPDFYQCSISVNGVSDVFELVRRHRAAWRSYNIADAQIGEFGRGLKDISPVNFPEAFKAPVLLVHGDSDRQVYPDHSQRMHDALKRADKQVTYIELPNEDHYLSNEDNRLTTFKAMGDFLDKHLPTSAPKATAAP